jgi:plastocyanin
MHMIIRVFLASAMLTAAAVLPAFAQESYKLTIGAQGFEPAALEIPAGKKVTLEISNTTKKPAEFESSKLGREKVVPPGKSVTVSVGPLKAGSYEFEDDFNKASKGTLTVK